MKGGSGVWPEAAAASSACLFIAVAIPHRSGPLSLCSALTVTLEGTVRRPLPPPPTCLLAPNIPV